MRPIGKLYACLKINAIKKFTFCSLTDFVNGLDPLYHPAMFTSSTIQVVLVPKMNNGNIDAVPVKDKSIALVAASALTHIIAAPWLQ
jgi:hypothetical protein